MHGFIYRLYPIPLIHISVFVPELYSFDYCSFIVSCKVRDPDSSSSIFLSQDALAIQDLLCFYIIFFVLVL